MHELIAICCLLCTIAAYVVLKKLHRKFPFFLLVPLLSVPVLLLVIVELLGVSYADYIHESHWLLWMLGPATIAFAVPVYENRHIMQKHWLSLSIGVLTAMIMGVGSTVILAKVFHLSEMLQRSLSMRSITTPFAIEAAKSVGGKPDLTALFVVITGVIGLAMGEIILNILSVRTHLGKGAGLAGSAHGAGTAKAYSLDNESGVVASLVMLLTGVATLLLAPLIGAVLW